MSHKSKSIFSHKHTPAKPPQVDVQPTLSPIERFRMSVRKVMHITKTSNCLMNKGPGAEPGVDVRRDSAYHNYGHIRQNCLIEIADYSSVRSSFGRMTNQELINLLSSPRASEREPWVKVRWINVGGISWDVVRALALKYGKSDLHPPLCVHLAHVLWVRPSPTVSRGSSPRPRKTPFWCRLLQEASLHPCPQSHPQQRRAGRTKLPREYRPFVFSRTNTTHSRDRRLAQVLNRRESLLRIDFQVFAQVQVAPQVRHGRTWRLRCRKRECLQASPGQPKYQLWLILRYLRTYKSVRVFS